MDPGWFRWPDLQSLPGRKKDSSWEARNGSRASRSSKILRVKKKNWRSARMGPPENNLVRRTPAPYEQPALDGGRMRRENIISRIEMTAGVFPFPLPKWRVLLMPFSKHGLCHLRLDTPVSRLHTLVQPPHTRPARTKKLTLNSRSGRACPREKSRRFSTITRWMGDCLADALPIHPLPAHRPRRG